MTDKQLIDWAEKNLEFKFSFWKKLRLLLEFNWESVKRLLKSKYESLGN
jgi:hypothetical protein